MSGAVEKMPYDEFGLFHENAAEYGIAFHGPPVVRRTSVEVERGRSVSALRWGHDEPELVVVHGGSQNAHTWDTVLLALDRPAVAIDLPGHGHSDWRDDGRYDPVTLATDLAEALTTLAPIPPLVVGMSLGGLTSMVLAARFPELVRSLVMVDITPGVNRQKAKAVIDFVSGPQNFASFDELLARTMEHNPTRSESSLRRGILHNAHQLDDGSWEWRYDRRGHARTSDAGHGDVEHGDVEHGDVEHGHVEHGDVEHGDVEHGDVEHGDAPDELSASPLWDDLGLIDCPALLVRGGISPVVDDDDVAEACRRLPDLEVEVVEGAGHSVQGDRPLELADLIRARL